MKKALAVIVLVFFAILAVSPVVFLLTGTFMGDQELMELTAPMLRGREGYVSWRLLPRFPTLQNVVGLLLDSPEFFQMFWNSVKMTGCILAGQLIVGMPAAWGMARYSFRGRGFLYMLYIVMMMMPFQVTMLSEYLVLDAMGLMDTSASVILPGIYSTFSVFIMYRFFSGIPESIIEAARIDGAGEVQIFLRIGIALGRPGVTSALVLAFLECWNMIEQPMTFLATKSKWPLSLFLPEIDGGNAGLSLCASLAALLPAIFVFLMGQDYLEQGIASSAVKE